MSLKRKIQYLKTALENKSHHSPHYLHASAQLQKAPDSFSKAIFNFTIDFELIWSNANDDGRPLSIERRVRDARTQAENFTPFLELVEELEMPVSWAIVGILADPTGEFLPRKLFQPEWEPKWYEIPKEIQSEPELWDGEAYFDHLKKAKSPTEILSHSYAHIDYRDPSCSKEIARADLEASLKSLQSVGFQPKGFVFPSNRLAHLDVLSELEISICRGDISNWHVPEFEQGELIHTPMGFWLSPAMIRPGEIRTLVREAIQKRAFIHPWIHLIECSLQDGDLKSFYRPLFEEVKVAHEKGQLEILRFEEISQRVLHSRA